MKLLLWLTGINSKMDEVRAEHGLINLKQVDQAITKRQEIANYYRNQLQNINGIRCINDIPNVQHNYSYFPIFVDENKFGISRRRFV